MQIALLPIVFLMGFVFADVAKASVASDGKDCSNEKISVDAALAACNRLTKQATSPTATRNIYHWRGLHLAKKGDYDAAINDLDRAIAAGKSWPQSYDWRGYAWTQKNNPAKAVDDFTQAIKISARAEYYEKRASQLQKLKEYDRAEADMDQAIRLEPANTAYYLKRGDILKELKKFDKALADVEKAMQLSPRNYSTYHHRGYIWNAKGETQKAIDDFSEAIKLDGRIVDLFKSRAEAYSVTGDWRKMIDDYDAALRIEPNNVSFADNRIAGFLKLEEYDVAIQATTRMIEKDSGNAQAYNFRGLAFQGKKEFDSALVDVNKALSLAPTNGTFLTNKSNILRETGQLDEAIRILSMVIADGSNSANAYNNRSLAWRAKNDLDRALRDLNEAIRLVPTYVDAYVNRGQIFEALGDRDSAVSDYRSALTASFGGVFIKRYQRVAQVRIDVLKVAEEPQKPLSPQAAQAELADRRIALVIGNGAYSRAGQLVNPPNDANLLSKALRQMNFSVAEGVDLDHAAMKKIINEFMAEAPKARVALVFYAGHGMQIEGKNYLLPVDADTQSANFTDGLIEVDSMLSGLDDQIRTNIIILDACRDNPLANDKIKISSASRSVSVRSGLAAPSGLGAGGTIGAGTLLAFATAPGQVALDGDGANSPFSSALNKHISTPGIEIQQMLTRVRNDVVATTRSKQVPWSNSSLLGEVYLAAKN